MDEGKWENEGQNEEHFLPVDAERVLSVLPHPVGQDVHKFETFGREEADKGVNRENPAENAGAADHHQRKAEDFVKRETNSTPWK